MKLFDDKPTLVRIGLWTTAFLMLLYMLQILIGDHGLLELRGMKKELSVLKKENARLEQENIALYRTINRLKNDPAYIEHVARQELRMIATDEIVFKFETQTGEVKHE